MTRFHEESVLDKLKFLRKGDKILLIANSGGLTEVRTGETTMDGHAVAKGWGWITGNHRYDDPLQSYINVKLSHRDYTQYGPNESIYQTPDIKGKHGDKMSSLGRHADYRVLVEPEVYARVICDSHKTPEEIHPELVKVPEPTPEAKEIALIEAEMAKLQARLEAVRAKV